MVVEYQDYLVVIAALDAEWSRASVPGEAKPNLSQSGEEGAEPGASAYSEEVWTRMMKTHQTLDVAANNDYCKSVQRNYEAWCNGNGLDNEKRENLDPRLFSVQTWLPFGHLDALSFFAVDDLDAAHAVIERYPKTVEEVTTAFCPKMENYLSLAGKAAPLLANFLEFCHSRNEGDAPDLVSPMQRERPLALLSRLRMSSIFSMGRGLLAQAAIFRLMARAIGEGYEALHSISGEKEGEMFNAADIDSVRVCFLDLQDEEEIGLFVTGTNYTVMMALTVAMQNLTVERVLEMEPDAAFHLFSCRGIRNLLDIKSDLVGYKENPADYLNLAEIQQMADNHAFRWSRSVAAVSPHLAKEVASLGEGDGKPTGWVEFQTLVGLMVGHQKDSEDALSQVEGVRSHLTGKRQGGKPVFRLHTLGINDLVLRWKLEGTPKAPYNDDMIPVINAVGVWPSLLDAVAKNKKNRGRRRDFTAWNSLISIPVPEHQIFHPPVGERHHLVLHKLMGMLEGTEAKQRLFSLNEQMIRQATGSCGLPVVSRRPLIFLSQNFHQITSNPLIFDVVLDFFDLLETLAYLLCKRLPGQQELASTIQDRSGNKRVDRAEDYTLRPSEDVVEQLNDILGAIDDALSLRLRGIYPEDPVRDLSLDLRSQNHQILLAADAVLKSAVAIFRKDVLRIPDDKLPGHNESIKRTLGVVLRLKFQAGMNARPLKALRLPPLIPEDGTQCTHLAIFEGDYPHLRSILVYEDFFHESFHLIFEELATRDEIKGLSNFGGQINQITYRPGNEPEHESTSLACREMFVHFMMLLFVFDGDADLLIRDHLQILAQAVDRRSRVRVGVERENQLRAEERARRFAEKVFHALGPIIWLEARLNSSICDAAQDAIVLCELEHEITSLEETPNKFTLEIFADKAWKAVEERKDAFPDYTWVFENDFRDESKGAFITRIAELYASTYSHIETLWGSSTKIFTRHVARVVGEFRGDDEDAEGSQEDEFLSPTFLTKPTDEEIVDYRLLQKAVDTQIHDRWNGDTIRCGFRPVPGCFTTEGFQLRSGEAFDPNMMVRRTLYHYLKQYRSKDPEGRRLTLARTQDGKVDQSRLQSEKHAPFLLDRTAVNHFCCVPSERRLRLGRDIAALKTMWGISSRNRARRLTWLIGTLRDS